LLCIFNSLKGTAKIGIENQFARVASEIICRGFKRVVFWRPNESIAQIKAKNLFWALTLGFKIFYQTPFENRQ
jgi:hypothetical protein